MVFVLSCLVVKHERSCVFIGGELLAGSSVEKGGLGYFHSDHTREVWIYFSDDGGIMCLLSVSNGVWQVFLSLWFNGAGITEYMGWSDESHAPPIMANETIFQTSSSICRMRSRCTDHVEATIAPIPVLDTSVSCGSVPRQGIT